MSVVKFREYYDEDFFNFFDEKKQKWVKVDRPEITHYACSGCGAIKSIKKSPPHKALVAFTSKDTQREFEFFVKWKMLCKECFLDKEDSKKDAGKDK